MRPGGKWSSSARRAEATWLCTAAWANAFLRRASSVWARSASACEPCPLRENAAVNSASCSAWPSVSPAMACCWNDPQQVEVGHGHEQQQVMGGGRARVLPGCYLLACDARLENRVRQGELGRQPGNRRRTAAHRVHPQSAFDGRAAGHGDCAIAILQWPVMVLVIDAGLNRRQPKDLGAP